jgi:Flp pilus assembly protein TadB
VIIIFTTSFVTASFVAAFMYWQYAARRKDELANERIKHIADSLAKSNRDQHTS